MPAPWWLIKAKEALELGAVFRVTGLDKKYKQRARLVMPNGDVVDRVSNGSFEKLKRCGLIHSVWDPEMGTVWELVEASEADMLGMWEQTRNNSA